jgi:hypothetical protein
VDDLETADGMAVHAYVHRKGGQTSNAEYWYERAGKFRRPTIDAEWQALVEACFLAPTSQNKFELFSGGATPCAPIHSPK